MIEIQIKKKLKFCFIPPYLSDNIYIYIYSEKFLSRVEQVGDREKSSAWVFDLVPDCPQYRKEKSWL